MEVIYNLDAYQIQKYQQNRYPLLFVDKITEAVPGEYAKRVYCMMRHNRRRV